jgi:hypothetical protein
MSGQTHIVSGHVPILTLSHAKSIERHAQAMENILPQNANVIKTTTERDANIGTSAPQIKTAVFRENVLTLGELHCHVNNAIVNWAGLGRAAAKVCLTLFILLSKQNFT